MLHKAINKELFIKNRERLVKQLQAQSIAIFNASDEVPRSADSIHTYRQNPDLFYLTGINQEQTALVIFPDCPDPKMREALFIRRTSEHIAVWEGHKHTIEEARAISGIENVYWFDTFESKLPGLMYLAKNCYLNLNEHGRADRSVPYKDIRFAQQMKKHFPLHHYERLAPIMHDLRAIKSDIEVEFMQEACNITEKAFRRVMGFIKPGVWEFEIGAEIMHEYLINRANGPAYPSIIASGKNACVLHYVDNDQQCKDGDLILMDFGADYANYAADLTRTIPVNGRYTDRQKDVYNSVLHIMKEATKMLVPGTMKEEFNKEVGKITEAELIKLGLLDATDVKNQNPDKPLYKKYFMHGTSHFLGIDVHDVGHQYKPMAAGMVFTCEPGIYIPKEGIGVRIENDVLVTNNGPHDLMRNIPREVEEIEEIMNSKTVMV